MPLNRTHGLKCFSLRTKCNRSRSLSVTWVCLEVGGCRYRVRLLSVTRLAECEREAERGTDTTGEETPQGVWPTLRPGLGRFHGCAIPLTHILHRILRAHMRTHIQRTLIRSRTFPLHPILFSCVVLSCWGCRCIWANTISLKTWRMEWLWTYV